MSMHDELSAITPDRAADMAVRLLMPAATGPESQLVFDYLNSRYPTLVQLAGQLSLRCYNLAQPNNVPDDRANDFFFGAVTMVAVLARHAEQQALGE